MGFWRNNPPLVRDGEGGAGTTRVCDKRYFLHTERAHCCTHTKTASGNQPQSQRFLGRMREVQKRLFLGVNPSGGVCVCVAPAREAGRRCSVVTVAVYFLRLSLAQSGRRSGLVTSSSPHPNFRSCPPIPSLPPSALPFPISCQQRDTCAARQLSAIPRRSCCRHIAVASLVYYEEGGGGGRSE